jgi:hypothetical protein
MVVLSGFYLCMYFMDASFEDARHFGWIAPLSPLGALNYTSIMPCI